MSCARRAGLFGCAGRTGRAAPLPITAAGLLLSLMLGDAARPAAQAPPDYEAAITAYRDGRVAEAMRALTHPRVTREDHPQRAVRRAKESIHAQERGVLELMPRLQAMAAAHIEAYLLHAQHRDTIPARWHYRASTDALDALDWMARVIDPRATADGFRQIVHDTHAHQLAILGDHAQLIEFAGELRRSGHWSGDTALATGTSFDRRAHDAPAWSVAIGHASFEHWRLDHLRSAERALEEAQHLVPDVETVHLRISGVRLALGRPPGQFVPSLQRLAGAAESRAVRYLSHLFLARWHEREGNDRDAVASYGDALAIGHGSSACAGLQYHAAMGAVAPSCPEDAASTPDPWSRYLSGDIERLDVLTLRLREASRP